MASFFFIPLTALGTRTEAGRQSRQRLYPETLSGPEPGQGEGHLLPLHVRHGHGEHPLCLRCRQGHHPPAEPEGVQPRVNAADHTSPTGDGTHRPLDIILRASDMRRPSPLGSTAPSPPCRPQGQRGATELVRHLNLAKLFQSLDSKIVFIFLFLTFGLLRFLCSD